MLQISVKIQMRSRFNTYIPITAGFRLVVRKSASDVGLVARWECVILRFVLLIFMGIQHIIADCLIFHCWRYH